MFLMFPFLGETSPSRPTLKPTNPTNYRLSNTTGNPQKYPKIPHHFNSIKLKQLLAIITNLAGGERMRLEIFLNSFNASIGQGQSPTPNGNFRFRLGGRGAFFLAFKGAAITQTWNCTQGDLMFLERGFVFLLETQFFFFFCNNYSNASRSQEIGLRQGAHPGGFMQIQGHAAVVRHLNPPFGQNVKMVLTLFHQDRFVPLLVWFLFVIF